MWKIGNIFGSRDGKRQDQRHPEDAPPDLSWAETGKASEAAEPERKKAGERTETFTEVQSLSIGPFLGGIEIVEGPQVTIALSGLPGEVTETRVSCENGVVSLKGPENMDHCWGDQSIVIINDVVKVGRNFNGVVNGVPYRNGKPASEKADNEPPLCARITIPSRTDLAIGSVEELACHVPLGNLTFNTKKKSRMTFGKVEGVGGIIGGYSTASFEEINGTLSAEVTDHAALSAGAVNCGEGDLTLTVSEYAHADIARGECAQGSFRFKSRAVAAIQCFKTSGALDLDASGYAHAQYDGVAQGNVTAAAKNRGKIRLKANMGGSLSIGAKEYAAVKYEGEVGGEVVIEIKDRGEVDTSVALRNGSLSVNASHYSGLAHKGDIPGQLAIMASERSRIGITGNTTGDTRIDADQYAEVRLQGDITGNVTASASERGQISTKGLVSGSYTATAREYAGVRHSGKVAGSVNRKADRSSTVEV